MSDRPYWCEICARKKECYGITLKPKCFVPTADRKTEPQTCEECEHWNDTEDGCADRHGCKDEPQTEEWYTWQDEQEYHDRWQADEPQTDCAWK